MDNTIEKMLIDMQLRGMSPGTQRGYVCRVKVFLRFYDKPVTQLVENDIRAFFTYLIKVKKLSYGSVNTYNNTLRFFYETTLDKQWNQKNLFRLRMKKVVL